MKRKIVVTMALAFWVTDQPGIESNEAWENDIQSQDELDLLDLCEEATIIKVEITETKQ